MALKFNEVKPGDIILSLEMDRRSLCPILEACKILRVGKEFTDKVGSSFGRLIKLEVIDSTQESHEIIIESDSIVSVYDRVIYSTSPEEIYQELQVQKHKAQSIIDNTPKYELCVAECEKAMQQIYPKQSDSNQVIPDTNLEQVINEAVKKQLDPINNMVKTLYDNLVSEPKN